MKNISIIIVILLFTVSCQKYKPPIGEYIGTFCGEYILDGNTHQKFRSRIIEIKESNREEIIFESGGIESFLTKNKDEIIGTFSTDKYVGTGHNEWDGEITINGLWQKKSGMYIISGSFESTYSFMSSLDSTITALPVKGSFEIKSEF